MIDKIIFELLLKDGNETHFIENANVHFDFQELIKELRSNGLSYREISKETSWSKATICRVLNGMYD